jgi:hypothetical protein
MKKVNSSCLILYVIPRVHWCGIIVLNAHALIKNKSNDTKNGFYEELESVFDKFPYCHMKMLLRDFNAKVGTSNSKLVKNLSRVKCSHIINALGLLMEKHTIRLITS